MDVPLPILKSEHDSNVQNPTKRPDFNQIYIFLSRLDYFAVIFSINKISEYFALFFLSSLLNRWLQFARQEVVDEMNATFNLQVNFLGPPCAKCCRFIDAVNSIKSQIIDQLHAHRKICFSLHFNLNATHFLYSRKWILCVCEMRDIYRISKNREPPNKNDRKNCSHEHTISKMLRFNQSIVHLSTIITLNDFILIISDISIDFSVFLLKRNFILSTCQVKYSCSYNFRMVSSFFKVSSSIWIWFNYKYKCNGFLVLRLFFLLNFQFFKTFKVIRINARM